MLIINNEITIRSMEDDIHDYQLMTKWRSDEKVLQFYGGRDHPYDLEEVIETYQPRIKGQEALIPCIFAYRNREIGYLQYYDLDKLPQSTRQMYCLENTANVYGIDLFIGETEYWHRGIGTKVLLSAMKYIFNQLQAGQIVIDPNVKNIRAIRCYEKSGFVKVKLLPGHDLHEGKYQDCWLMARNRNKTLH